MLLDDAVKISEVQNMLDGDSSESIKAWRKTKHNQMMYAWSTKDIRVSGYSGPGNRRLKQSFIQVYRRSTLFYSEVKGKEDWEIFEPTR